MTRVWEKVERLRPLQNLRLADFGTRRRHSFLWQDWCVQALREGLGDNFGGTSNCLIAKNRDLEAIGTNAHELPMVYSALAETDEALAHAPYDVLADWHEEHDGNLRIILPDTYGTQGFLDNAPDWLAGWTGIRVDSGDPAEGAETAIRWWKARGEDPSEKLVIFSDGLDVDKIVALNAQFQGRVRMSFGWGTLLTNDFRGWSTATPSPRSRWCARRCPRTEAPRSSSRTIPARRWDRRTRSSATSGCSGWVSRLGWRWWFNQISKCAIITPSLKIDNGPSSDTFIAKP